MTTNRNVRETSLIVLHIAMVTIFSVVAWLASPPTVQAEPFVGPESLTDDELIEILRIGKSIDGVDLRSCKNLTDKCLPALGEKKKLNFLMLPANDFSVESLSLLKGIGAAKVSPYFIKEVPQKWGVWLRMHSEEALREMFSPPSGISLRSDAWVDELRGVHASDSLETVLLGDLVTDRGAKEIVGIAPNLRTLTVGIGIHLTDSGVAEFAALPRLEKLRLNVGGPTGPGRSERGLPEDAKRLKVTSKGLAALAPLSLYELRLPYYLETDDNLGLFLNALRDDPAPRDREFMRFSDEKEADAARWPWTRITSDAIKDCKGVKEVEIRCTSVPDESLLASLWTLPDLVRLEIFYPATGEGFVGVERAPRLESIWIRDGSRLKKEFFSAVGKSRTVKELTISDAVSLGDDDTVGLVENTSLRNLHIDFARDAKKTLGPVSAIRLKESLPGCKVEIRGP